MRHFLEVASTGLTALMLHPLRGGVSFAALVVVFVPYLVGLGLASGLEAEAEASAAFGADLHVSGRQFGRPAPLPTSAALDIRRIQGVVEVVPRIMGEVVIGKSRVHAVLVGLPADQFPDWSASVEGELPRPGRGNELVIGTTLARRLSLKIGSTLLPFYRNNRGERLSRIVGIFRPNAPPWQTNLILTTLETAEAVFDQPGLVTDLLVSCRPGYSDAIAQQIEEHHAWPVGPGQGTIRARVTSRPELLALLHGGLFHREGTFNLLYLLVFVVGILVLLVTSGLGLTERRREVGILKALGWQTDEILLRAIAESLALSLGSACTALLLAWIWLRGFNGFGIAGLFLAGTDLMPTFSVPFRLTPVPALLAFVLSFVVVSTGSLASAWRAATAPPREAMR